MNTYERLHKKVRERQGTVTSEGRYYSTDPEPVSGLPGGRVTFVSIRPGFNGIEPGVYVATNVAAESYRKIPEIRDIIGQHVCLALMERRTPISIEALEDPQIDVSNGIVLNHVYNTREGAVVLRVDLLLP